MRRAAEAAAQAISIIENYHEPIPDTIKGFLLSIDEGDNDYWPAIVAWCVRRMRDVRETPRHVVIALVLERSRLQLSKLDVDGSSALDVVLHSINVRRWCRGVAAYIIFPLLIHNYSHAEDSAKLMRYGTYLFTSYSIWAMILANRTMDEIMAVCKPIVRCGLLFPRHPPFITVLRQVYSGTLSSRDVGDVGHEIDRNIYDQDAKTFFTDRRIADAWTTPVMTHFLCNDDAEAVAALLDSVQPRDRAAKLRELYPYLDEASVAEAACDSSLWVKAVMEHASISAGTQVRRGVMWERSELPATIQKMGKLVEIREHVGPVMPMEQAAMRATPVVDIRCGVLRCVCDGTLNADLFRELLAMF